MRATPGWKDRFALHAENRSLRLVVGEQNALEPEAHITESAVPEAAFGMNEIDGHGYFDLVLLSEPLLVHHFIRDARRPGCIDRSGHDRFIFRIRFFRNQGARQIEFRARPALFLAE